MGFWKCSLETMVNKEILEHFKGKSVLITGHTGFKGSWMTHTLANAGANVTGYALSPVTTPNLYTLLNIDQICRSYIADINDTNQLSQAVSESQPDFIFHLAAQPLVRYSYKNPLETFQTNVLGTANILEACRNLNKKCSIVCITTDKVYYNQEWPYPYRENDRLGGHDPYSASKAASEIVIDSYRKSYFSEGNILVASARAGNVIGGGDWSEDRLIPDIIRSILSNKPIVLRNPNAVRPWQHVLDPIFGYLLLAKKMDLEGSKYVDSWNFGPNSNESMSVLELCKKMVEILGMGEIVIDADSEKLHETNHLTLDISKAINQLNWKPVWDTKTTIEKTASWYLNQINKKNNKDLVNHDINRFLTNESI